MRQCQDLTSAIVGAFEEKQLLLFASAISFQILTAVVPLLLFAFGVLGLLDLRDVWQDDVRPELVPELSTAAMTVVDDTVNQVFDSRQEFWVTSGAALAIWQVSGAVRASMDALNRVYGASEKRSRTRRYAVSIGLAAAIIGLGLLALAVAGLVPLLIGDMSTLGSIALFFGRWTVAGVLLFIAVGLVVHHGPDQAASLRWASLGSIIVVVSWSALSIALFAYLRTIASYGSLFGNLATVVVLAGYVYFSSVVFLTGVEIDAQLRARHKRNGG